MKKTFMGNKKAQVSSLTIVLIFMIVLVLIIGTYFWGRSLLEVQELRTTTNYIQAKFIGIENDIMEVVREGTESRRAIRIEVPEGTLNVANGPHCSGGLPRGDLSDAWP